MLHWPDSMFTYLTDDNASLAMMLLDNTLRREYVQ